MLRIDHATAVATPPARGSAGTPGYFTDGNPATSTPATVLTADWANQMQESIMQAIVGSGQSPSKTDDQQLWKAIKGTNGAGWQKLPSGLILQWGNATSGGGGTVTVTLPTAFPTGALAVVCSVNAAGLTSATVAAGTPSSTQVTFYAQVGGTTTAANVNFWWVALGY